MTIGSFCFVSSIQLDCFPIARVVLVFGLGCERMGISSLSMWTLGMELTQPVHKLFQIRSFIPFSLSRPKIPISTRNDEGQEAQPIRKSCGMCSASSWIAANDDLVENTLDVLRCV
jgi:hypothetical protein